MHGLETLGIQRTSLVANIEKVSAAARLRYLTPSRYFRFYMLHERSARKTCWLPEGYTQ